MFRPPLAVLGRSPEQSLRTRLGTSGHARYVVIREWVKCDPISDTRSIGHWLASQIIMDCGERTPQHHFGTTLDTCTTSGVRHRDKRCSCCWASAERVLDRCTGGTDRTHPRSLRVPEPGFVGSPLDRSPGIALQWSSSHPTHGRRATWRRAQTETF